MKKKRSRFFLKLVVAILAIYASVTLVTQQMQINETKNHIRQLEAQREEKTLKKDAFKATFGSELDNETIARIAREEFGLVFPNETVIVDIGR